MATWGIRPAGSWSIATGGDPTLMDDALALPASWPIDKTRLFVRADQIANLPEPPPDPPPERRR